MWLCGCDSPSRLCVCVCVCVVQGNTLVKFESNLQVSPAAAAVLAASYSGDVAAEESSHKLWMLGNRQYALQIVTNLVSNALKFTQKGSVTLSLCVDIASQSASPRLDSDGSVATVLADCRDGIPTEVSTDVAPAVAASPRGKRVKVSKGRKLILKITVADTGFVLLFFVFLDTLSSQHCRVNCPCVCFYVCVNRVHVIE